MSKKIEEEFNSTLEMRGGAEKMNVSLFGPDPSLQGMTLSEVAEKMKKTHFEVAKELLKETHGQVQMIFHVMDIEDVRRIMIHPYVMVASDGYALANYGSLALGSSHPRSYGCFPRILARFVREEKLLKVEEAVKKMTHLPASRFRLEDRGLLRKGKAADIVIFDPLRVQDKATFDNPHQYPVGIPYVMVNGKLVIERGEHTGSRPGKILRNKVS
jgi:N-acyl-D-amino-acid deacylase